MTKKLRTIDVEVAMMRYYGVDRNMIVPNVSFGMNGLHECDLLILSKAGYATEIEIKVSKTDLLKDKEKKHNHVHYLITNFYYAVPEKLKEVALQEIPDRAGLFIVKYLEQYGKYRPKAYCVKSCIRDRSGRKWTKEERYNLARLGIMRILGLKEKIAKSTI